MGTYIDIQIFSESVKATEIRPTLDLMNQDFTCVDSEDVCFKKALQVMYSWMRPLLCVVICYIYFTLTFFFFLNRISNHVLIFLGTDTFSFCPLRHFICTYVWYSQKEIPRIFPPLGFHLASSWSMMPTEVVRTIKPIDGMEAGFSAIFLGLWVAYQTWGRLLHTCLTCLWGSQ